MSNIISLQINQKNTNR